MQNASVYTFVLESILPPIILHTHETSSQVPTGYYYSNWSSCSCFVFVFLTIGSLFTFLRGKRHRPKMKLLFQINLCSQIWAITVKWKWNCSRSVCARVWRLHVSFPQAQQCWWFLCGSYDRSFPTLETRAGNFCPFGSSRRKKNTLNGRILKGSVLPLDCFILRRKFCAP